MGYSSTSVYIYFGICESPCTESSERLWADQYVVQNLTLSGVYLRSTLSKNLLQKVLTLVSLTATGTEVFVATMTKFLYDSYDACEETLNHMNSLKLKSYPGENVTDCCAVTLVDSVC